MAYQIQIRSDSANNWSNVNPVLAQAEMGYETDTGNLKIGDGTTAWANLSYFAGGGNGGGNYSNAMVSAYLASGQIGNIVPAGNNVQSLGNATNQWKDLWISNNTIYINSVPLSLNSNTELTVAGNPVVTTTGNGQANISELSVTGNVAAEAVSAVGNVTATYFFGDAGFLSNIPGVNYSNANVADYLASNTLATDINSTGNVSVTGNVTAAYILGDGGFLSNISATNYSNANVADYLASGTLATSFNSTGNINTSANVYANNIISYHNLDVSATITGVDIVASSNIAAGANLNVPNVHANVVYANIVEAQQIGVNGNIATLGYFIGDGGLLSNINVSSNYSNTNVASYLPNNTSNVAATYFIGDGSQLTGMYGNANVAGFLPTYTGALSASSITANVATLANLNVSGDAQVTGNLNVLGTFTQTSVSNLDVSNAIITLGSNNVTNVIDEGIFAQYGITGNTYYSGLVRDHTTGFWNFIDSNVAPSQPIDWANSTYIPVKASTFIGDGGNLSNVNYSNVVGAYTDSNVAAFLTSYTGNISADVITSGNLSVLNTANIVSLEASNATVAGNVIGNSLYANNYFYANGQPFTAGDYSNANVANYLPVYSGGISGNYVITSGNITTGSYFHGNGAFLTGITANYSDANVITLLSSGNINTDITTTANVNATQMSASGNITADYFLGNGSQLTGMYGNADVANFLPSYDGNLSANVITANSTITELLTVNGDAGVTGNLNVLGTFNQTSVSNLDVSNAIIVLGSNNVTNIIDEGIVALYGVSNVSYSSGIVRDHSTGEWRVFEVTGNVSQPVDWANATYQPIRASAFIGDGSALSNIQYSNIDGAYGDANVAAYLPTYTGDLAGNNLSIASDITANGNAYLYNISSTGSANLTNLSVIANVAANGILTDNYYYANGVPVTFGGGGDYSNANVAAFLANLGSNSISTTGSVTATYFVGDGGNITNLPLGNYGNSNVEAYLSSNANIAITIQGNVTADYFVGNGALLTGLPESYGNANVVANLAALGSNPINTTSTITAANFIGSGDGLTFITGANVSGAVPLATDVVGNVQSNITQVGTLANLTVTDYVIAGRLEGNGNTISNIQWANITDANTIVANYLASNANVQITTTGNIVSSGNITADLFIGNFQGNITGNLVVPGSNTDVIFNNNGNAGADAGFTYDAGNAAVAVANALSVGNTVTTAAVVANNITVSNSANLGAVANLVVTGGNAGQFMTTDGAGNLSFADAITVIPAVYFTAAASGNNQTFANTELAAYASAADLTVFYNGSLLDSGFYSLSGDTLTVMTPVDIGDSITVSRQTAATVTNVANNPYGNANVAAYLPTYTGNISAGNVIMPTAQTPASSLAAGTTGQMVWDGNYIYLCIAPNTWKRVALSSF